MSRNRSLRPSRALAGAVGAVALTGLLAVSGCGTGQMSQTAAQISAVNGVSAEQGAVLIRDARIAYPAKPVGGTLYGPGADAPVEVSLINTAIAADRLVRVSSPISPNVTITGNPAMPQNVTLMAKVEAEGGVSPGSQPLGLQLTKLTAPIRTGLTVPLTFTFAKAGSVTVAVPVSAPAEGTEPERAEGGEAPASAEPAGEAAPAPAAGAESTATTAPAAPKQTEGAQEAPRTGRTQPAGEGSTAATPTTAPSTEGGR